MSLHAFKIIMVMVLVNVSQSLYPGQPAYRIREIVNYNMTFSSTSNVTLVFTTCGAVIHLRQAILSFFFYNTFPLRSMILVDRCSTPQTDLKAALPLKASQNMGCFTIISFSGSEMESYQKAFQLVKTKYAMNLANKWITYDGMGYIEQAIDAIEYGQKNGIKISQVTSLFPMWLNYRSLGKMTKTNTGTIFYEIRTFKPTQRYYFTFNPSLINLQAVFDKVMNRNVEEFCNKFRCAGFRDRDCCEKALGKQLHDSYQYIQVFIDDSSITAKVFQVK